MVRYHPNSFHSFFFSTFNLGVAMVAMVAMPREYTEDGSRQMKLPKRGDGGNERADLHPRSLIFPPRPKHAKADASFVIHV